MRVTKGLQKRKLQQKEEEVEQLQSVNNQLNKRRGMLSQQLVTIKRQFTLASTAQSPASTDTATKQTASAQASLPCIAILVRMVRCAV